MTEAKAKEVKYPGHVVFRHENTKLAIWIFLGGEVIFFTTLILTFIFFRIVHASEYVQFKQNLNVPLVGVNTFILIASSYMVVRSLEGAHRKNLKSMRMNMIGVILLGAVFLGGQAYEWITLINQGYGVKDLFGTPFFTITGIHGTHVLIGVIWAVVLLIMNYRKPPTNLERSPVEIFGLYWHFVDIVWIFLFTLFYLI